MLQRALNEKVRLQQGERERIITKAAAGIAKLVDQFAIGDRYARRDVIALAGKLGVDLAAGHGDAIEKALATTCQRTIKPWWMITFGVVSLRSTAKATPILALRNRTSSQPKSEENDHASPISRSRD